MKKENKKPKTRNIQLEWDVYTKLRELKNRLILKDFSEAVNYLLKKKQNIYYE